MGKKWFQLAEANFLVQVCVKYLPNSRRAPFWPFIIRARLNYSQSISQVIYGKIITLGGSGLVPVYPHSETLSDHLQTDPWPWLPSLAV